MATIIFSIVTIILISLVVYITLKRKVKYHKCFSRDVMVTGEKRYNEDSVAVHGSPNSYHEIEYKCSKCGNSFWEPKQSVIFNYKDDIFRKDVIFIKKN